MTSFEDDPLNAVPFPPAPSDAPAAGAGDLVTGNIAPVPEDLRISWSWPHFLLFISFAFGSLMMVQMAFVSYLSVVRHVPMKKVENLLMMQAPWIVAMQIVWFMLVLLFLYVTLSVLRDAPFWSSLGWRSLATANPAAPARSGWRYFFTGCGLSLLVAIAGQDFQPKGKMPIEEIFKSPHGAMLLMALAVLVAPLVEETLFRGYLYPLFARKFGVPAGIVITGCLFGLMHGAQLGWTVGLVGLLSVVGVIFTYVRARTHTVLASYLLHLGYNSFLAVSFALATRGFRHFPGA